MSHTYTIASAPGATPFQASPEPPPRLRVGVLIRKGVSPGWVRELLQQINSCGFADPILVLDGGNHAERRFRGGWKHIVFPLWRRWDRKLFKDKAAPPAACELAKPARNIPIIEISSASAKSSPSVSLTKTDIEKLQAEDLDVLLDCAHGGAIAALRHAARHGVWFFHDNAEIDVNGNPCVPAAFRCMFEGAAATETSLVACRSLAGAFELLHSSSAATDPVSLVRSQNAINLRRPHWIMRLLSALHRSEGNWQAISQGHVSLPPPPDNAPGNFQMLRFLARRYTRALWSKARNKLTYEQWMVGVRPRNGAEINFELNDFVPFIPPPGRFYADPFVIEKDGKSYLFFEELSLAGKKGIISCAELDAHGYCGPPRPVLEMDYHLSYPFVFEWRGQMYMLPETRDSGQISLFRALEFPWSWKLDQVLMENVWAVDPTLLEFAGKFWLFAGGVEKRGDINSELYLFFAESPFGPWRPHPLNPIVSDVRRARPAGKLFFHRGALIRPAQDCSLRYGSAIVFNTIVALSETEYREEPLRMLQGDWLPGNLGSHTFNSSRHFQVVDGRRLLRRPIFKK
ncbi:MAG TPA: hypothetical protein VK699_21060 [Terriglobales bacterium]|jgi:hypothetical protein|nr:hypothetical protein [Terriglobales bacterium]